MKIEDKKKVDILLTALKERYSALSEIRHRVQSIGLWALGLLLGAAAWVFQTDVIFSNTQKILSVASILTALIVIRFYIGDLQRGYRTQQRIIVEIEQTLGFYDPKDLTPSDDSLYPQEWQDSGTSKGRGNFFRHTYDFIYVGAFVLIIFIIINGHYFK